MSSSSSVLDVFRECGLWSYLCLFVGAMGIVAGLIGALLLLPRSRDIAWIPGSIAVFLGLSAVASGLLGRQMGLARLDEALAHAGDLIAPDEQARIREQGHKEANGCVPIGFVTGSGPLLLGGVAAAVGFLARRKSAA